MAKINFYNQEVDFRLKEKAKIRKWILQVVENEYKILGEISYIFCTDTYLLDINQQYLKHNTYTDIVTFDYSEEGKICGDLFISIERVNENAQKFSVNFEHELKRVLVHGILHLCGYKDKSEEDEKAMRAREDYYLSLQTI
jgi:probable rRNA maturation factor